MTNKTNTRTHALNQSFGMNSIFFCNIKSDPTRISYCAKVSLFPISYTEAAKRPTKPSLSVRRKQKQYFTQKIETIRMKRRSNIEILYILAKYISGRWQIHNLSKWIFQFERLKSRAHVLCFRLLLFISVLYVLFVSVPCSYFLLSLARFVFALPFQSTVEFMIIFKHAITILSMFVFVY